VQSTHKIPATSATSWSRYLVAQATRGTYYTHDGEGGRAAPTRWHGPEGLLCSYGIDPDRPVELSHLRPLMHGCSPVDGQPIRPAGSDKTRTAGVDLTFSAPKDVSALWAVSGPYRRAQIETAHRQAVASALAWTEREVAVVRRKHKGIVRFQTPAGLLAAEAVHTTSRLSRDREASGIPDPQLHSHVAVIAAVRKDGVVAAVESRQLYRAAREGGAWYRAELAANLRELGLPIQRRTGHGERYFAIPGVPSELAEGWSTRSQDVERAARVFRTRYGREPREGELDSLTLGTRGAKSSADPVEVSEVWRAVGEEHGLTSRRSEELFNDWGLRQSPHIDLGGELLREVTRERATITTRELRAKAYELAAGVCRPSEAEKLLGDLARTGKLIQLQDGTWTTRELRKLEATTIETARQRASERAASAGEQALRQARREIGKEIKGSLTSEQRQALETVTGTGGVAVLVGRAGTGKGVVIAAAARAWQLQGNTVIGTAIAGATAQRLREDAKLDHSYTTDSLIKGVENGHIKLGPRTVVVTDEAGMADTHRKARLIGLTAQAQAKLLLVGDAAQLSSIGPGGLFKELEDKVPTAELREVHRANHAWERRAWEQIRAGEPGPALAQYQAHGRLHIHDTRAQAAEAMVNDWDGARKRTPDRRAVMLTDASNKERDEMNAMAQARRGVAGELGSHRVTLPGKPYGLAVGDEVVFTGQFHPVGQKRVENGIGGTILDTSREESRVTIKTREREPREVQLDTSEFGDLSLGYAVHVHRGQGLTTETSGILMGGWQSDREHAYVAVSRAREQTQIYLAREDLGEHGMDTGAIERLGQRIARSRAQEASIAKKIAQREDDTILPVHDQSHEATQQLQGQRDRSLEPVGQTHPGPVPIDILKAQPAEVQINVKELADKLVAHSQVYNLESYTGEPTLVMFGAWRTETEQGFAAVATNGQHPQVRGHKEPIGDQDLESELRERIATVIEHSQSREQSHTSEASTPPTDRERPQNQTLQLAPGEPQLAPGGQVETTPPHADRTAEAPEPTSETISTPDRDPYIEQAIQDARDRQAAWEQSIEPETDRDHGYGIE
jgi:conjugative relaxase-like TrwC/TraI family protein